MNNHGMTPGYIARSEEQAKAAFSWRWSSAAQALRDLDPDFDTWFDSYPPEMTKGEILPLMEERISVLQSRKRLVAIGRISPGVNVMEADPNFAHNLMICRNEELSELNRGEHEIKG